MHPTLYLLTELRAARLALLDARYVDEIDGIDAYVDDVLEQLFEGGECEAPQFSCCRLSTPKARSRRRAREDVDERRLLVAEYRSMDWLAWRASYANGGTARPGTSSSCPEPIRFATGYTGLAPGDVVRDQHGNTFMIGNINHVGDEGGLRTAAEVRPVTIDVDGPPLTIADVERWRALAPTREHQLACDRVADRIEHVRGAVTYRDDAHREDVIEVTFEHGEAVVMRIRNEEWLRSAHRVIDRRGERDAPPSR